MFILVELKKAIRQLADLVQHMPVSMMYLKGMILAPLILFKNPLRIIFCKVK